jgi:hypothetical protein
MGTDLSGRQSAPAPRGTDRGWTDSRLWQCLLPFWTAQPSFYNLFVIVDPAAAPGPGFAGRLGALAQEQGYRGCTECREDSASTVRFLEQAGFVQIGIRRVGPGPETSAKRLFSKVGRVKAGA